MKRSEWKEALSKLNEHRARIRAMQESIDNEEKKFNKDFEEFMSDVLLYEKGQKFHLVDLIAKASELD